MLIDRKRPLAIRASTSWRLTGLSASGIVMAVMVGLVGMPRAGADSDARASVTALPGGDRAADAAPNSVRDGAAHVAAPNQPNNSQRDSRREGGAPEKMPEEMLGLPGQPSEQLSFLDAAPGDFEIENCLVALAEDFQVPAQTAGVLEAVEVREGDVVTSGQRVARIDDEQVRLKLEEAKASLEELKAKELTLEEATVEARHAQELLAQVKAGYEAGVKPVEMMSRCSLDSDLAKVRVAKAEADLESARQLRAVQVAAAESELNRYRVEAPLGGIVVETHRRVGEWVNPGDPVCRIVNVAKLRVEGFVSAHLHPPEAVADRDVTVGVFRGRTGAEVVPGKIIFVDPSVTSSNEYRVWAEVENPNRNGQWVLRPGQRAKMTVKMTRQTGRAAKPEEPND